MDSRYIFQTEKIEDCRSGKAQVLSNIEVCNSISSFIAPSLGPYGLDKLFYGEKTIMTNDGATILKHMNYTHPIAKIICGLSKSQDDAVGDGTTSVVLLTAAVLNALVPFIKDTSSYGGITQVLKEIKSECLSKLEAIKVEFNTENVIKLAEASLNSKSIRNSKEHFAKMLVTTLQKTDDISIEHVCGGSVADSEMVEGIAFERPFTYAGYEQQPRHISNPKICCLNVELEWKAEHNNAEVRINGIEEYQRMVDAEWSIINNKLHAIKESGANVVLSSLPIGDYATQYFAAHGIFSAGRVQNLGNIAKAFGGAISQSTACISLSTCDVYEERQMGKLRLNYFRGTKTKAHTMLLRGPGEEAIEEVSRAVNDAMCAIKSAFKTKSIIAGGGSSDMVLSKLCRDRSFEVAESKAFIYKAMSMAFEKIPATLSENFGLDVILVMQMLRRAHSSSPLCGISLNGVDNMLNCAILEPLDVKRYIVKTAFNMAELLLTVDSTIIEK
ncbi:T-complex protein 1 subunit eta [Enteropsectra breve]|nr:T-complex protein 1 subunit eta [Enteropsectra breve]